MTTPAMSVRPRTAETALPVADVAQLQKQFHGLGYYTADANLLSQLWLCLQDMEMSAKAVAALCLDGPPGTGKTFLAQTTARFLEAPLRQLQFTVGVGREVMMHDIDIAAVVAKQALAMAEGAAGRPLVVEPDDLVIPGVLQEALRLSHQGKVVLLLDEIDKAKPYVDSMLLEFLEECAIAHPTKRGQLLRGDRENLLVIVTKNNERGITEPLMRRVRSVYLEWPGPDTEAHIVKRLVLDKAGGRTFKGDVEALASSVISFANRVRKQEKILRKVPSSPEVAQAVFDALRVPREARGLVVARQLFKYREDYEEYHKKFKGTDDEVSAEKIRALLPNF